MPFRGRESGSAFSATSDPPGRSGASHSSQATHTTMSAKSTAEARLCRMRLSGKLECDLREPLALRNAQRFLVLGHRLVVGDTGEVTRPIRCAAGARGVQASFGIRRAEDQHAVVQERQHHGDERRFLAAVQACARREHARRLAGQRAALPEKRTTVPEMLQRRRHVAEASGAAEREAGAFLEVAELRIRWTGFGDLRRRRRGREARHRAHARHGARHALDAIGDQLGHAAHRAVDGVVKNEHIGHRGIIRATMMIRNAWRYLIAFAAALPRRLFEDRLTQAAGSLTYTTLLSIVPLVVVALALSTAFPAFDRVIGELQNYLINNFLPKAKGIDTVVRQFNTFASGVGKLTGLGLGVLGVTAVMLMLTVDDVMNRIFRVERKRSLAQRVATYWAVLTLGPLLFGAGISMTSALTVHSLGLLSLGAFVQTALGVLPFVLTWAGLVAIYILVPNRPVPLQHALAGALLAGVVFEVAKRLFAYYVSGFPAYTLLYGTFAALFTLLVWVYLSWLIVLVGATFTATLVEPTAPKRVPV